MEKLFTRLYEKCGEGIPYLEAVQLILWAYCTLDVLPSDFRQVPLSRQDLAAVFAKLGSVGKVILEPVDAAGQARAAPPDIATAEHWDGLIVKLLLGEKDLDQSFPLRVHRYV